MSAAARRQSWAAVGTAPWSAIWARIRSSTVLVVRPNLDQGVARIVPGLADGDLLDPERAAVARDAVEDLRQDQAVDDVAADLDVFHRQDTRWKRKIRYHGQRRHRTSFAEF